MMLLQYNIHKKKAIHNPSDNYISINQLFGGYNPEDDDYDSYFYNLGKPKEPEDFGEAHTDVINKHWKDMRYQDRLPKHDPKYEPMFSEAMLMYCCYNEQFVGGGVGVGDSPASAPMGFP